MFFVGLFLEQLIELLKGLGVGSEEAVVSFLQFAAMMIFFIWKGNTLSFLHSFYVVSSLKFDLAKSGLDGAKILPWSITLFLHSINWRVARFCISP